MQGDGHESNGLEGVGLMAKYRVARSRNLGTETEAKFFGKIRDSARKLHMYWKPMLKAKKRASINSKAFRCEHCGEVVPKKLPKAFKSGKKKGKVALRSNMEADHIVPCGSLNCFSDISGFYERLFCENPEGYRIICKPCHHEITYVG